MNAKTPVPFRSSRSSLVPEPDREFHRSPHRGVQKARGTWSTGCTRGCAPSCVFANRLSSRCTRPRHVGSAVRTQTTWSGRRDSNPRPSAWKAETLPLSYSRLKFSRLRPTPLPPFEHDRARPGKAGGRGRIRTSVARKGRQIYSLLPLATRPPVHTREPLARRTPSWKTGRNCLGLSESCKLRETRYRTPRSF